MHIEKNICENIVWTLLKVEGKTKDTMNAWLDLHDMNIRPQYHGVQQGTSLKFLEAHYVMTEKQRAKFCKFLKGVKFSDGYVANLAKSISADGTKAFAKLRTHTCHVLLQRIIPASLRGFVPKDVYEAISELGNFFRQLCSRTLRKEVMEKLKKDIPLILCKLEKIFPPAFSMLWCTWLSIYLMRHFLGAHTVWMDVPNRTVTGHVEEFIKELGLA
jgi:hypothetical protein